MFFILRGSCLQILALSVSNKILRTLLTVCLDLFCHLWGWDWKCKAPAGSPANFSCLIPSPSLGTILNQAKCLTRVPKPPSFLDLLVIAFSHPSTCTFFTAFLAGVKCHLFSTHVFHYLFSVCTCTCCSDTSFGCLSQLPLGHHWFPVSMATLTVSSVCWRTEWMNYPAQTVLSSFLHPSRWSSPLHSRRGGPEEYLRRFEQPGAWERGYSPKMKKISTVVPCPVFISAHSPGMLPKWLPWWQLCLQCLKYKIRTR